MGTIKRSGLIILMTGLFWSWPGVQCMADDDSSRDILKQGLLGAGTGAIASSASGGNAGKGALIGAGTNVIGGALLDTLFSGGASQQPRQQQVVYAQQPQEQSQPQAQPVYYQQAPPQYQQTLNTQLKKKIIRRYDSDGHVVSEEEVWE